MSENINGFDVDDGKRLRKKRQEGKVYFIITEKSVLEKVPNPGSYAKRDDYSKRNFICEILTAALNPDPENPVTLKWIAALADDVVGTDEGLWLSDLAGAILECAG